MALPLGEFKVFISHATDEDGDLSHWIAEALDRLHIRAFVYERYRRGGQNRFEVIKKMIDMCPYFLVLLTQAGISSQWVNQEIGYAVAAKKEPIPVFEEDRDTGKLINSRGFVELNDPIGYKRGDDINLMSSIVYALVASEMDAGKWNDIYFASCKCGNDFDGKLDFNKNWFRWVHEKVPHTWKWICPSCKKNVKISFPDCHIVD